MDDYVDFLDDFRHVYSESLVAGPSIDDMVTFCLIVLHLPRGKTNSIFLNCVACAWVMCVYCFRQSDWVPLHEVWARLICLL